jgi:DNA-binding NarL/FixJ family response regulator
MKAIASRYGPRPVRILLVDDHPVVRLGFEQLLSREADLTVCGEASTASEALELAETLEPDLAVIDIALKGESGLELVRKIAHLCPRVRMLVCSMHDEALFAERALKAGARGYVGKREAPDDLVTAVREVLAGKRYLSARFQARLEEAGRCAEDGSPDLIASLSNRELEVFDLIGRGLGTREISERLGIAFKTVETYRENIKTKLVIESGPELAHRATAWVLGAGQR